MFFKLLILFIYFFSLNIYLENLDDTPSQIFEETQTEISEVIEEPKPEVAENIEEVGLVDIEVIEEPKPEVAENIEEVGLVDIEVIEEPKPEAAENIEEVELDEVENFIKDEDSLANKSLDILIRELPKTVEQAITDSYLFILFVLLLFLILALAVVIYMLYLQIKWRRRYTNSESVVFKDTHLDFLEHLEKWIKKTTGVINENQNVSMNFQKETLESLQKITSYISDQSTELDRYREGYDFSIKKNVLLSLVSIFETLKAVDTSEIKDPDFLKRIIRFVESHLENHDVKEFVFEQGQSFRNLPIDEFEICDTEIIQDKDLDELINKTEECGYYFFFEGGKRVLKKARIIVYRLEKS